MALTVSTGFVVDDAIVVIENIVRFIEKGESPLQAALKGAPNWFHGHFDQSFARGRFHSAPVYGRNYRPLVS